jgi:hypothetical protein
MFLSTLSQSGWTRCFTIFGVSQARPHYFVVATRLANTILPSGRNAHLIIEPAAFWVDKIKAAGFDVQRMEVNAEGREVKRIWAEKKL